MIKLVYCIRRRSDLTPEEFQHYWLQKHAPLVREVSSTLRMRRYVQSHSFGDPRLMPSIDARQHDVAPYDGITEVWWDSIDDILAVGETKEGRAAGRRLLTDEQNFIDLVNSTQFFTHEHEIFSL